MRRTGQRGAILGFIVGSILLAFLLIGGVYLMNRQSDITRPAPQVPVVTPEPQQPSPAEESRQPQDDSQVQAPQTPAQLPSQSVIPQEIPQTGPREALFSGGMLAILGGVVVAYVRSRRQSDSL